jgi:hypothetical protein
MKKLTFLLIVLISTVTFAAGTKLSDLPLGSASTTGTFDSFPYVNNTLTETQRLYLSDIPNIPALSTILGSKAPIASPTFTGTVTAPTFVGSLVGSSTSFSGSLVGDVTGTQGATVVSSIGGATASNVASGATAANGATNLNSASTIVKRDSSGNFSAGTITATLNGNITGSAGSFSGSLSGDVTGTQTATVVDTVGGSLASDIHTAEISANAATELNTPSAIVKRDSSGNFNAGTITAGLSGTATAANNLNRNVNTSAPLTGGGTLTSDLTISIPAATSSQDGYLTSTGWSTFNNKQSAGNYITALTGGDVSATGPGSVAATVNSVGGSSAANINTAVTLVNSSNAANEVFASPNGSSGIASFRSLVNPDIPSLPVNQIFQVDGSRIDSYTADGSLQRPFKTIGAAISQIITNADNASKPYNIFVAPGVYGETLTFNNALLYNVTISATAATGTAIQNTSVNGITSTSNNTHLANLIFNGITINGNVNLTGDVNNTNFGSTQVLFSSCMFNNGGGTITFNNVNNINIYNGQLQGTGSVATFTNLAFGYVAGLEGIKGSVTLHLIDNPGGNVPSQYSGNYLLFSETKFNGTVTIDAGSELDSVFSYFGSLSLITNNGTIHSWSTGWDGTTGITLNNGSTSRFRGDTFFVKPILSGSPTVLYQNYTGYTPGTSGNWNTVPSFLNDALDTLATSGVVKSQSANVVLASPNGSSGVPSFRALVSSDIPSLPYSSSTLTSAHLFVGNGSNVSTDVAASGDLSLANTGAFTLSKIQGTTVSGTTGTGNVVFSASPTITGTISAAAANFSGSISASNLSGTNTGDITLTAVGASPSANAATLSGQALTLQPFDGTHPGVVTSSGGGSSNFLRADGSWAAPSGSFASPMTTLGDIIYENSTPAATRLAGNTTSTKNFLTQTGTGSISAAPSWGTIASADLPTITLTSDVTGAASGGSVSTTIAGHAVSNAKFRQSAAQSLVGNSTNATADVADISASAADQVMRATGAGTAIGFGSIDLSKSGAVGSSILGAANGGSGLATLTAHDVLVGNGTSAVTLVAPSATAGVPLISNGSSADPSYGTAVVGGGGTGATSFTAYSVIAAGTTSTGAFQNVSGVGSSGQVLTSNGASALPTWQAAASGTTSTYFQGYMSSSSDWNTTSSTFADGTNSGGNTLTTVYSNGITVTAAASNVAGITFTPAASTSVYLINAIACVYTATTGFEVNLRMTDGTTAFGWNAESAGSGIGTQVDMCLPVGGIYAPGTGSAVTVKIQLSNGGAGTAHMNAQSATTGVPTIQWTVMQIK